MHVQSVLVEFECPHSTRVYSNSGFLFGSKSEYLLTTSNILTELLLHKDNVKLLSNVIHKTSSSAVPLQNIDELLTTSVNLKVVKTRHHKKIFENFKVVKFFISQEIKKSAHKLLFDWSIDDKVNGRDILHALSIFFVSQNVDNSIFDVADFSQTLLNLLNLSEKEGVIERLQSVFIESAPFGNRYFLDSYSEGIISNVLGTNNCLFLTDCSTVPGCEGAVIFRKPGNQESCGKIPIGIVLSSYNIWKGDYLVLTVGASLQCILRPIIYNSARIDDTINTNWFNISNEFNESILSSVVQIKTSDGWGSAILYDKKRGIFITNSHIIEDSPVVEVQWRDLKISCQVLYKTLMNQIYDLAILQCIDKNIGSLKMCDIQPAVINSHRRIIKGEAVVAVGYPLFDAAQHNKATVTSGHVMHISAGSMRTTCAVLPGSSGGGLFARSDGCLLGVMVCNARMEGVNYANVNMAVPVMAFSNILRDYIHTGDIEVLKRLSTEDEFIRKDWRFTESKL